MVHFESKWSKPKPSMFVGFFGGSINYQAIYFPKKDTRLLQLVSSTRRPCQAARSGPAAAHWAPRARSSRCPLRSPTRRGAWGGGAGVGDGPVAGSVVFFLGGVETEVFFLAGGGRGAGPGRAGGSVGLWGRSRDGPVAGSVGFWGVSRGRARGCRLRVFFFGGGSRAGPGDGPVSGSIFCFFLCGGGSRGRSGNGPVAGSVFFFGFGGGRVNLSSGASLSTVPGNFEYK